MNNKRTSLAELMGLESRLELYGLMIAFAAAFTMLMYGASL